MANVRRYTPFALMFAIAGALLYLGWATLNPSSHTTCSVCARPVHLASRVDGVAGDDSLTFCCAACALRAREQDAPSLEVTRVFDYVSGQEIDPSQASVVVGSEINLCMREHILMDDRKEASELHYDRCVPSVLAFASQQAAYEFRAEHGGVVKSFTDLEGSFK
jgi:hypothetical protein